jgi:hypothetical protein
VSEHEQRSTEDEQVDRDETVEDLDVPETQQDDIAGGLLSVEQKHK